MELSVPVNQLNEDFCSFQRVNRDSASGFVKEGRSQTRVLSSKSAKVSLSRIGYVEQIEFGGLEVCGRRCGWLVGRVKLQASGSGNGRLHSPENTADVNSGDSSSALTSPGSISAHSLRSLIRFSGRSWVLCEWEFCVQRSSLLSVERTVRCGLEDTWKRLIEGQCGVRAISLPDLKMSAFDIDIQLYTFDQLTSKVAALVPCGPSLDEFNEELWLKSKEHRSITRFIGYAFCATDEALDMQFEFPLRRSIRNKREFL